MRVIKFKNIELRKLSNYLIDPVELGKIGNDLIELWKLGNYLIELGN